jgi:ribonuclease D
LDGRLEREGRMEMAQAAFNFLPTRAAMDIAGFEAEDIFAHS